jgi:hypothetical protein
MRGPFEGTWQQGVRPTVVTAPDAIVYINGDTEMVGCASCHRRFDINKYITSIQVDLHVDSSPGSASISMSIPRHSVDEFYFDGNPLITPMMEVEIFAKGYFLVEGLPQYYPIFWGLVTEVSDNYSGGEHTFSINCADILKWWELCKMNITPAFTQGSGQLGKSIFGNVLFGSNPYDMIWSLAQQSFGDVVVGTGSLINLTKESTQKQTFNVALGDITLYWQQRFTKIRSNLMLYGTAGNVVRGDLLDQEFRKKGGSKNFASQAVRQANGGTEGSQMVFDPSDPSVTAFRTQFSQAGQVNFWTSEYQTKLEIANACKEAIGFEFFMDVTGDIVFKPPFYNLDVLSNKPVSWIQDIDIIDWDLSESEAEVVTQLQLSGSFGGNIDYGMPEEATPTTSVTDYHLLRKYGWRTQTYNSEFSANPVQMFNIGLDMLDRMNSKRFRGSVNIPLRPELRLGFPIYLAPKDQVWYVSGISHSIPFGGRAQTTLTLTAKRSKFVAPNGIGSMKTTYSGGGGKSPTGKGSPTYTAKQLAVGGNFTIKVGDAAQLPPTNQQLEASASGSNPYEPLVLRHPKTGRLLGYPNVVLAYTRPFVDPGATKMAAVTGRKDPTAKRPVSKIQKNIQAGGAAAIAQVNTTAQHTVQNEDILRQKYLNNRHSYGLNSAGVYAYIFDQSAYIKEMVLVPTKNIKIDSNATTLTKSNIKTAAGTTGNFQLEGATAMIRPVSDERGFEVIGHFRYGRGVSLTDGSLVLNSFDPGALNTKAAVSFQLAMTGELTSTLQSQSSGLTTASGASTNPAKTIASLQPDDLQTGASINPDTKQPQFSSPDTNFVDAAPLGSPKQAGAINTSSTAAVEAGQLSHALTLAEMAVKEPVCAQEECDCLTGRGDLGFINVGYQINVVGVSGPVTSTASSADLDFAQGISAKLSFLQDVAVASAIAGAPPDMVSLLTQQALTAFQAEHQQELDAVTAVTGNAPTPSSTSSLPITDTILSQGETIGRVEGFLANLYTALDTSHQQYEAGLRGDALRLPQDNPQDIRFAIPGELPDVAPPFGGTGRSLSDPVAQAALAVDAFDNGVENMDNLSQSLQAPLQRAQLQQEITDLLEQVGDLSATLEEARNATPPASPSQINQISNQLDKASQQLAKKQQDLNVLNATSPPV